MPPTDSHRESVRDLLIFGTGEIPALRHEVPVTMADPAVFLERKGRRILFAHPLETNAARAIDGLEVVSFDDLGLHGFLAEGRSLEDARNESIRIGCQRVGLSVASTPSDFPLGLADHLRDFGIQLQVDGELFEARRRAKNPSELLGVRRAQQAAEFAMETVRARLERNGPSDADELRALARSALVNRATIPHELMIVACGPQGANPHGEGTGRMLPHQPIVVDIFPRDAASGCWGDLTRTYCVGEAPDRLRRYHADVAGATKATIDAVRPGVTGDELNRIAASYLSENGHRTKLDDPPARTEGFVHAVGHGIGLELHEDPRLDVGCRELAAGEIVAIEPGVYYPDLGGVRIEDLVLVTEEGHEVLSTIPYDLEVDVSGDAP